ncbi:MAG TPA: hypothetical protein VJT31_09655, partial [Rugosimonospora sp.]|nr:hypothetical protein [Rugosimonospora sp.]
LGGQVRPLTATVGAGVRLTVTRVGDGWVGATAQTDCRATLPTSPAAGSGEVPGDIATLYRALGTAAAGWHTDAVPCPAGQIATTDAYSTATDTGGLVGRLAAAVPAGGRRFANPGNRLIWRQGGTSVIVAASDDGTSVTVQRTVVAC